MTSETNRSICGLSAQDAIPANDTTAFISDAVLVAVNVPLCVFAFLSNLLAIVAIVRTPALHKPSNILLSSLAFTDCLSGAISQPLLIARRLMIHRVHISCDYQLELYILHRCLVRLTTFLSFANLTLISFDRHYALSKPLRYRADATSSGKTSFIQRTILQLDYLSLFINIYFNTLCDQSFYFVNRYLHTESKDSGSTTQSVPETSFMKAGLLGPQCFVLAMLPHSRPHSPFLISQPMGPWHENRSSFLRQQHQNDDNPHQP